jgi:hypothetical protein
VSLETIGEAGSFDAFREQVIEEQLKKRYVKDLLCLLNGFGAPCIDEAAGERFVQLIELVLRRNVHVHNRGVVDDRYLEKDGGAPKYNPYGLKVGDVARIDEAYWETAARLLSGCVRRLAVWADG